MSIEQHLRGLIEAIAEEVALRFVPPVAPAPAFVRALPRKQACEAMGIGRTKLADLIAAGDIQTVADDPRLIPVTEIERYCAPKVKKPRRQQRARPVMATSKTRDIDSLRATLKEIGRR